MAEFDRLEFTPAIKSAMISLLNGIIPELEALNSLEDAANIPNLYWRFGSLINFFNMMFNTRDVLYISDVPQQASIPRHMNEAKVTALHRYLKFWLIQFYYCDDVIDTLRFNADQLAMTTLLLLNLFHNVRHSLPQVRALFDLHWTPELDDLARYINPLLRYDRLTALLQFQLEHERVSHQETKKAKRKLHQEVDDLRVNLQKSRSTAEKLKGMLEQAKKENQQLLLEQAAAARAAANQPISLLNNSGSASTLTFANSAAGKSSSLISSGGAQLMPRRRGRPRKNPLSVSTTSRAGGSTMRTIKPATAKPIAATITTSSALSTPLPPIVIPQSNLSLLPSVSSPTTSLLTTAAPPPPPPQPLQQLNNNTTMVMAPTAMIVHSPQSLLSKPPPPSPMSTAINPRSPPPPPPPPSLSQLILTPSSMMSLSTVAPIVSLGPGPAVGPINYLTAVQPPGLQLIQPQAAPPAPPPPPPQPLAAAALELHQPIVTTSTSTPVT